MQTEKREKSEEDAEELSHRLAKCKKGDRVKAIFFKDGYYAEMIGEIDEFNTVYKYMKIGNEKVFFDDLYEIERRIREMG